MKQFMSVPEVGDMSVEKDDVERRSDLEKREISEPELFIFFFFKSVGDGRSESERTGRGQLL